MQAFKLAIWVSSCVIFIRSSLFSSNLEFSFHSCPSQHFLFSFSLICLTIFHRALEPMVFFLQTFLPLLVLCAQTTSLFSTSPLHLLLIRWTSHANLYLFCFPNSLQFSSSILSFLIVRYDSKISCSQLKLHAYYKCIIRCLQIDLNFI